ncbi:MAG: glycosyltransferase [Oscillospiraceae bacterium]|nr:glycosyltransferase [Oscillospiraceae bacterium]
MKLLILLTTSFPLGSGEDFLSAELLQATGFDRILVCPCSPQPGAQQTKPLPESCTLVHLQRSPLGKSTYARLLFCPAARQDLSALHKAGQYTLARAHDLVYFLKHTEEIYTALKQAVSAEPGDSVVLYSYWLYEAAAAAVRFAKDLRQKGVSVRLISRAHGFDIHKERRQSGYLPLRPYLFAHLDHIFPCSQDGAAVLQKEAGPALAKKITCAYLGTNDCGLGQPRQTPLHLVSCSYMVPVKRLHLILSALEQADFPVTWTHLGGGPLEAELREKAKSLPPNVTAEFLGQMKNTEVLEYYKSHPVTAFVNVSESEGVPVTVMEAASFGIPAIATNVGGTHELVQDGTNGFLLPKAFAPQELLAAVKRLRDLPTADYTALCENARGLWAEKFNAEKNYQNFYHDLSCGSLS